MSVDENVSERTEMLMDFLNPQNAKQLYAYKPTPKQKTAYDSLDFQGNTT